MLALLLGVPCPTYLTATPAEARFLLAYVSTGATLDAAAGLLEKTAAALADPETADYPGRARLQAAYDALKAKMDGGRR